MGVKLKWPKLTLDVVQSVWLKIILGIIITSLIIVWHINRYLIID